MSLFRFILISTTAGIALGTVLVWLTIKLSDWYDRHRRY